METVRFKPMLYQAQQKDFDLDNVNYPMYSSYKLDGIRCIFRHGEMLSRTLKPIRNKYLQEKFKSIKQRSKDKDTLFDGELYSHELTFQEITSIVMSEDKVEGVDKIKFHCFDSVFQDWYSESFDYRIQRCKDLADFNTNVVYVEQRLVMNSNKVMEEFREAVEYQGYEGLILRRTDSPYKCGRVTIKSGDGYKIKPYITLDAPILDIEERMYNKSESYINKLGHLQKHKRKDDQAPTGIAGAFVVDYEGEKLKVMTTGDLEFRKELLTNKEQYIGKHIEYKAMMVGIKDLPRHPTFLRFRKDKDED